MSEENNVIDVEASNQNPQSQKPNPEQAVNILKQASRQYRGVRDEHDMIDASVKVLEDFVKSQ